MRGWRTRKVFIWMSLILGSCSSARGEKEAWFRRDALFYDATAGWWWFFFRSCVSRGNMVKLYRDLQVGWFFFCWVWCLLDVVELRDSIFGKIWSVYVSKRVCNGWRRMKRVMKYCVRGTNVSADIEKEIEELHKLQVRITRLFTYKWIRNCYKV